MGRLHLKVCGITPATDLTPLLSSAVDLLGFNFVPSSPRYCSPEEASRILRYVNEKREDGTTSPELVGVFRDDPIAKVLEIVTDLGLHYAQLHGNETPSYAKELQREGVQVIKALSICSESGWDRAWEEAAELLLFDSRSRNQFGGVGDSFQWDLLKRYEPKLVPYCIAGGIGLHNVTKLMKEFQTQLLWWGMDVNSRFELAPGKKSPGLLRELFLEIERQRNL